MKDVKEGYPEQWLGGMSKGEGVAAEIRLQIVSGEIEVDTLLTENQVAKQFDVSRSPVRDAFKLLQTDQLIHLEMMKVAVKFEDAEAFTQHDIQFHEAMINASNHQYLQTFWNHLKPVIETLVLLSMRHRMEQDKADFERIHSNHEVFIEAVEQYDSTKLREAFHLNFDDVGEDIESFWLR